MGVLRPPIMTWAVFHEMYRSIAWGTPAYGWTLLEEQVESTDDGGRSVMLGIFGKDATPVGTQCMTAERWGVWFEWRDGELGVNGMWEDQVPAHTMMQVVPVRPVPATRWEVVA